MAEGLWNASEPAHAQKQVSLQKELHLFPCFLRQGLELEVIPLLQPPEFWDCRCIITSNSRGSLDLSVSFSLF